MPGLENATVAKILGAVPYETTNDERFIYLFAKTLEKGVQKLVFTKYDLESQTWDDEPTPLELPNDAATFSAAVEQRNKESALPHLVISISDGKIYGRRLKADGSDWEDDDFLLVSDPEQEQAAGVGRPRVVLIQACVAEPIGATGIYLFVRRENGSIDFGLYNVGGRFPIWRSRGSGSWIGAVPFADTTYAFYRQGAQVRYIERRFISGPSFGNLSGLDQIAVHCGQGVGQAHVNLAYQRKRGQIGRYRLAFTREVSGRLTESLRTRVAPHCNGPFDIPEQILGTKRELRRSLIKQAFQDNENGPPSSLTYLEEAYYFVPVHLALQLRQRGQYTAALDWFRTVYDYGVPEDDRKIYYGLELEESLPAVYKRAKDWLLDPLNPHAIATTRVNTYTRFTLLSLVRCFLEFADAEFTRDTVESIARARTLYMTALELLEAKELTEGLGECDDEIRDVDDVVVNALDVSAPEWIPVWRELTLELRRVPDSKTLATVIEDVKAVLGTEGPVQQRLAKARDLIAQALNLVASPPPMESLIREWTDTTAKIHAALVAQPIVAEAILPIAQAAGNDYLHTVSLVTGINTEKLEREPVELLWLRKPKAAVMTGGGIASAVRSGPGITAVRADMPSMELNPVAPTHMAAVAQLALAAPLHAVNIARKVDVTFIPGVYSRFCVPPNPV